jgi:hypothetical protein
MVTAVAGTLGLGRVAIHSLERLPTKFAEVAPSGRLAVNTSRNVVRSSRAATTDSVYVTSGTESFQPVADRTDPKAATAPDVLARKPGAQTRIRAVTTSSKGTATPAGEKPPHFEPIRAVLETLPLGILLPHLLP